MLIFRRCGDLSNIGYRMPISIIYPAVTIYVSARRLISPETPRVLRQSYAFSIGFIKLGLCWIRGIWLERRAEIGKMVWQGFQEQHH